VGGIPYQLGRILTLFIVITRLAQEPGTPNVLPSWQLVGAVFAVDILASFFALFGWISGPAGRYDTRPDGWVDIVTVVKIWLYSFGVVVIILLVCELVLIRSHAHTDIHP
jgi:H+-transporting ATPase